ncbi:putative Citrate synthase [Seiridium cardinale]
MKGDHLHIVDSRTSREYNIPIDDGFVRAADLSVIKAPETSTGYAEDVREQPLRVFDHGLQHTACVESSITLIDGYRGDIQFRGMSIEKLFRENDHDDVMHLLIWGSLPAQEEKIAMRAALARHMNPPDEVRAVISAFPCDADMSSMIVAGLSAYACTDTEAIAARHKPEPAFHGKQKATDDAVIRTIAFSATVYALVHCHRNGISFVPPQPHQSLLANLLTMMGLEVSDDRSTPAGRRLHCLQRLWILYADHEMANSTSSCLLTASTLTDPISSISAMVLSCAGPLHGGAIELGYEVLEMIGSPENVPAYIEGVKAKKFRLFGYGHRVYTTKDPRAVLLAELIKEHEDLILANPLLSVAFSIDKIADTDPYFVQRKLKANVELFVCFLYMAFGFQRDLLSGLILNSRIPGVMAHWREAMGQPIKLWRPRAKFGGRAW